MHILSLKNWKEHAHYLCQSIIINNTKKTCNEDSKQRQKLMWKCWNCANNCICGHYTIMLSIFWQEGSMFLLLMEQPCWFALYQWRPVGSWCHIHLCHTCWPCSWHHRHRPPDTQWHHSWPLFVWLSNLKKLTNQIINEVKNCFKCICYSIVMEGTTMPLCLRSPLQIRKPTLFRTQKLE